MKCSMYLTALLSIISAFACATAAAQTPDSGDCIRAMSPTHFAHVPAATSSQRIPEPQTVDERRGLHWLLWPTKSETRRHVKGWLLAGNFRCLEQAFSDLESTGATFSDGQSKLSSFLGGARDAVDAARGMTAEEIEGLMRKWLALYPDSTLAQVFWVRMLGAAAWHARGTGFADTVTPDGWRAFERLNREALAQANALVPRTRKHLLGQYVILRAAQQSSMASDKLAEISLDALRRFPNELDIPTFAAERLLPQWGGTTSAFGQFAQTAREAVAEDLGDRLYAYIYTRIAGLRELHNFPEARLDVVESGLVKLADTLAHEHVLMLQNFGCRFRREGAVWYAKRLWSKYALEPQVRAPSPEVDAVCRQWLSSLPGA